MRHQRRDTAASQHARGSAHSTEYGQGGAASQGLAASPRLTAQRRQVSQLMGQGSSQEDRPRRTPQRFDVSAASQQSDQALDNARTTLANSVPTDALIAEVSQIAASNGLAMPPRPPPPSNKLESDLESWIEEQP